jgi:hypothetical protein
VTVVLEPLQEDKPLLLLPSHLKKMAGSSPGPPSCPTAVRKIYSIATQALSSLSVPSLVSLETLKTPLLSEEDEGEGLCPRARVVPNANPGLRVSMGHHHHLFGCKTKPAIKHDGNCKRAMSCQRGEQRDLVLATFAFPC